MKNSLPMHTDAAPVKCCALVLLSGGLDSVALLHRARTESYDEVAAITFGYGQTNRDAEITAAGIIAARRGIPVERFELADAVRGNTTLEPALPGLASPGVSRSNIPARNPILISIAAAHACRLWPGTRVDLLVGATLDDGRGFPDCREEFVEAMSRTISFATLGLVVDMTLRAPWVRMSKADVLLYVAKIPGALDDVRDSVSCYRGTRCGACDPCTLRARAFAACGFEDGNGRAPRMFGGDPGRDRT